MRCNMSRAITHPDAVKPPTMRRYSGHITYIYAFDVAYEMARVPLPTLLDQPVAQFQMDSNKRAPRQLFFYRPHMVRLPPLARIGPPGPLPRPPRLARLGPQGPVGVERQIKLFSVGAISISVRVPFEAPSITALVRF